MKSISSILGVLILLVAGISNSYAQLIIKGTVYSESIVRATVTAQRITDLEPVYLAPARKVKNDGMTYYQTKYEVPWRMDKGIDHVIKFTDGLVEKMIYVSGAIPKEINPRQKYIIDIDLIESKNPDMTLIVFWSMNSMSYKALPLSKLRTIRKEAHHDFHWEDGTLKQEDEIQGSEF